MGVSIALKSKHIHGYGRLKIFITCLCFPLQRLVHREERGQEMKEKARSFLNFKTEFLSRCVCVSYSRQALLLCCFGEAANRSMRLLAEATPGVLQTAEYLKGLGIHDVNTKNKEFQAEKQLFTAPGYFLHQRMFTMSVVFQGAVDRTGGLLQYPGGRVTIRCHSALDSHRQSPETHLVDLTMASTEKP